MQVVQKGELSQNFIEMSTRLFERIGQRYETDNVNFAICGSKEDVYTALADAFGYSDYQEMGSGISFLLDRIFPFAILTFEYSPSNSRHIIYVCEQANDGKNLGEVVMKSPESYLQRLRKRLPHGVIV
jgi:hypothetical protein